MSRVLISLALALVAACSQKPAPTQARTSESSSGGDSGAPVAKWNGGSITQAELDAATYEQRKQALDQMLVKKLMEQKAKAENTTPEALYKREVTDKVKGPSDAEMKAFYDEQSKKQQLPPFDQIKDQISQYMSRSGQGEAQRAFVERLPRGRLELFAGYGHGVNLLQPERCARASLDFWRTIDLPSEP